MMTHEELKRVLEEASKVFILTDQNVAMYWLPELEHGLHITSACEIVIKPGESQKTLQTAQRLWKTLMRHGADRYSMMINFGGGVITDLGGFVASCYQRGIPFVNVPTTLLGMVDAAIGGKTGVDFGGYKNQIGVFAEPLEVMVSPVFLSTLPDRELLSGLAEMVKYGFIADSSMLGVDLDNYEQYILRAGRIKREIVAQDHTDRGKRKILNFGHTFGHAFESFSYNTPCPLTHGEAVALGMGCALWISVQLCGLPTQVFCDYVPKLKYLLKMAEWQLSEKEVPSMLDALAHDKKNKAGQLRMVLLTDVGHPVCDVEVMDPMVRQAVAEVLKAIR